MSFEEGGNFSIIETVESIVREKNITREEVFDILELAVLKASRQRHGSEKNIQVNINRETGSISLFSCYEVIDSLVINDFKQISLENALKIDNLCTIGGIIKIPLAFSDLGRAAAQIMREVIVQRIRELECMHQYSEFKDRIGEIIGSVVKRIEFEGIIVDVYRTECFLFKNHIIPGEVFNVGDYIKACIIDVRSNFYGFQVFLSRTHYKFVQMLFKQEISDIYSGVIQIKTISRNAGYCSKVSVFSQDKSIDPVRVCLGFKGSRIRNIVSEIKGERIDVVLWSNDPAIFISNSMFPINVIKVLFYEDNKVDVVVDDSKLSLSIGYKGQNIRLVSALTNYDIAVISETHYLERRAKLLKDRVSLFIDVFEVSDVIAHFLVNSGFTTVKQISKCSHEELKTSLFELDGELINLIINKAILHSNKKD